MCVSVYALITQKPIRLNQKTVSSPWSGDGSGSWFAGKTDFGTIRYSNKFSRVFFQNNLDDLIEYCIMLPRMFKEHHRYLLNMEGFKSCKYGDFNKKVTLWKREAGIH